MKAEIMNGLYGTKTRSWCVMYARKCGILSALTDILQEADYPVRLELSEDANYIFIHYDNGCKTDLANVTGDSDLAMLYDLFKQCGPAMMAKV